MDTVSNNTYLEMAKLDYNNCLAKHQLEWNAMQQWYQDFGIGQFGTSDIMDPLVSYYLAAASIFEPEKSNERIGWAKTTILVDTISSFFDSPHLSKEDRRDFVNEFRNKSTSLHRSKNGKPWHGVMVALQGTLHELALDALMAHSRNIHPQLNHAWEMWLTGWENGVEMAEGQADLIIQTINMTSGRWVSKELLAHPRYQRLSTLTNNICNEISQFHNSEENLMTHCGSGSTNKEIDSRMQELVQLVLCDSPDDLDQDLKHMFLTVAKTFYYKAYCDPETMNAHISKVLFEVVV
nr:ent-copalyl diphosphate synthase, chloroplastic-like [Tanacetum cinerariifolium]